MAWGDAIDRALMPFAPGLAARRQESRARYLAGSMAIDGMRRYDAAQPGRRAPSARPEASSADGENARGRQLLAREAHDLVRNNKAAAAGVRQMVATIWGDGIAPQFIHPVKRVQQRAQDEWDRWAEGKVDGQGDWYGHGKIGVREMIVGGESLTVWAPDDGGPDGRVIGLEGEQLDGSKSYAVSVNGQPNGKVVQGVHLRGAERVGYWLFQEHPNDPVRMLSTSSEYVGGAHVDHLYERTRFGQTRGASWLGAVATTLRDLSDISDARRLREKIQNCLALVIQPGEGNIGSPLGQQSVREGDDGTKPLGETLSPGMIVRLKPGETASTINPQPSQGTVEFIRQELAGVSANMVPYHLMTGDVSQANYSGLRAAMNGSYALVDDWQQNEVIPQLARPAALRRLRRLAMETGDRRFLEVRMSWALPVRRLVDPIKDLMGEIMEIRAGLKLIGKGLAERGINAEDHMREIKRMNDLIDTLGLALDSDPRRLTDSGVLQMAAGYIAPKGEN